MPEPGRGLEWCFPTRFLRSEPRSVAPPSRRPAPCREVGCQTDGPTAGSADGAVAARFFTGPAMRTALEGRLRGCEGSIRAALYCMDDLGLVEIISEKSVQGVSVQMVFDENQVRSPSCVNQHVRMLELLGMGASLYRLRVDSGFAILHQKLWVVDGRWVFTGSLNPTNNGFSNNDENLVEIDVPSLAAEALTHIDSLIARAEPLTSEFLYECVHAVEERKRSRSSSTRR